MKLKSLFVLIIVAVGLCVLAWVVTQRHTPTGTTTAQSGQPLLPPLQAADRVNGIATLLFEQAGATVKITRVNGVWCSPAKFNYPVNFELVSQLLRNMANAKIGQVIPAGHQQRVDMGFVMDTTQMDTHPLEPSSPPLRVVALDESGAQTFDILLGKDHLGKPQNMPGMGENFRGFPDGKYVEVNGQAYLITEIFYGLPATDTDWLEQRVLNLNASDIRELTLQSPDHTSLVLSRTHQAAPLAVADLKPTEEMNSMAVQNLTGLFSGLSFSDIADPALTPDKTGLNQAFTVTAKNQAGDTYEVRIGALMGNAAVRYLQFQVAGNPAVTNAELKTLGEHLGRWTFIVPASRINGLTAQRDAYIQQQQPAEQPSKTEGQEETE